MLPQHLHSHGALTGDHIGVIKGVNKGKPFLLLQQYGVCVCIRVTLAV